MKNKKLSRKERIVRAIKNIDNFFKYHYNDSCYNSA